MAKKTDSGCSSLLVVGAVMFFLGLMFKGGSGDKSPSTATTAYPQSGDYQSTPLVAPPQVKLPLARDGTVIPTPEKYVPKTVLIQKPVEVGAWDGKKMNGTKVLPAGTEVKIKGVEGYNLYIEVDGHWQIIAAAATDILEQMAQAAEVVE